MKSLRTLLVITAALTGLFSAVTVRATAIYTWEDENGTVHFSDQPRPGASKVDINSQTNTSPLYENALGQVAPADNGTPETPLPPATIRLESPHHQQTIRDNQGIIKVSAVTNRKLNKGHTVRLLLDGAPYGRPQTQTQWRLTNVDRGSHTLQAQVMKYGKVIASSEVITVYLHRVSQLQRRPPAVAPR